MPPPELSVFAQQEPPPSHDRPRPERLVKGNPGRITYEHFLSMRGDLSAGIWACEPGAWNIAFAPGKDEFFCVIEGRLRISDASGKSAEFGPGQAGVIPEGFTGTFEVIEKVRKYYVVLERRL